MPAVQKAVGEGWHTLRDMKFWDETKAFEYDDIRHKALKEGKAVHFGRIFQICTEKRPELEPSFRKYKGRVVPQGDQVTDQTATYAALQEMGSSASLMSASKFLDAAVTLLTLELPTCRPVLALSEPFFRCYPSFSSHKRRRSSAVRVAT